MTSLSTRSAHTSAHRGRLPYLDRPDPSPREACFSCGRRAVMVAGHIVCDDCHGLFGPCQRYVRGVYCGYRRDAS